MNKMRHQECKKNMKKIRISYNYAIFYTINEAYNISYPVSV